MINSEYHFNIPEIYANLHCKIHVWKKRKHFSISTGRTASLSRVSHLLLVFPSFDNPEEGAYLLRVIRLLFANEIKK